jgi:universal stress protein A
MERVTDILVPVDLSSGSAAAAKAAVLLAKKFDGAKLHFIHVYEPTALLPGSMAVPNTDGTEVTLRQYIRDASMAMLTEFVEDVAGLESLEWTQKLVCGTPKKEIVARAGEGACDLVVMGTHGRTGISHLLLGSVAERVVQRAPVPVLVVRAAP